MYVIHAHWQLPVSTEDPPGMLFWAESSEGPAPAPARGRQALHPRPKPHPFCAAHGVLQALIGQTGPEKTAVLRLPSTRTGPLPSPGLAHAWELDAETPPYLSPWVIPGVWLPHPEAVQTLLALPASGDDGFQLGEDFRFWGYAAGLVLETLAAQKIVPILTQVERNGERFQSRWLPLFDGPNDGPRLAQLEAALPPLCRSAAAGSDPSEAATASPRRLIRLYLITASDALARFWGRSTAPRSAPTGANASPAWLSALFSVDPTLRAPRIQIQALADSLHAWMRNLQIAGDAAYRITFRLEAPPASAESVRTPRAPQWQLRYLLQARDDPSLLIPAEEVWTKTGSILTELGRRFEQPQEKLLAGLGYAARIFSPIAASLKSKRPANVDFDTQTAYQFLREVAPLLEGAGFGLLVPRWWNQPGARLGLRLRLRSRNGQNASPSGHLALENLVDYQWELSLGETTLTEEEFNALAGLKSPLVQVRGQWVQLDPDQVEAAIHFWEKQTTAGELSLLDAARISLGDEVAGAGLPVDEIIPEGWLSEWLQRLDQPERMAELPQPDGLQAELRPYQRFGYSWLHFHRRWGLGACLADDMGLGKTIQTIALLLHEKETLGRLSAPSLLICPTSVVANWGRELQRFAPSLTHRVHQGADRLRGEDLIDAARSVDLMLTSYPVARIDAETLHQVEWLGVILDEAQNIKNPAARQTQAVNKFSAGFRLALTGTPVENRLSEMWSIMHFLNPGFLGTRKKFQREFAAPIERYHDEDALQRLKRLTTPFILRRVKTDPRVIQDLPEKMETKVYCYLTEEQATLYEAVVQDALKQIEEKEGIERRGLVLSMLMQLKQVCNHPVQYLHESSATAEAVELSGRSGKLERLTELLDELLSAGDRALIFTQFAEMGRLLTAYLPRAVGASTLFLHGGVPAKTREMMVRRFQEDANGPPLFILSLKAGGVGLNLTRANHVFHFDRWWNPAVEDQATDRAFRIGQTRNVQVHKFVVNGTLEEMIDDLIESKKGLAQAVVGSGESWLTELSTQELRHLVQLRRSEAVA